MATYRGTLLVAALAAALALPASGAPPGRDKGGGLGPLVVVDANGTTVGRFGPGEPVAFIEAYRQNRVFLKVNGVLTSLPLTPYGAPDFDSLVLGPRETVYFSDSGCTGQAYIEPHYYGVRPSALVKLDDGQTFVYLGDANAVRANVAYSAEYLPGDGPGGYTCWSHPSVTGLIPATASPVDITSLFVAPFHIE